MDNIQNSIIQTVAYFDVFDYPLTLLELDKYIISEKPITMDNIIIGLKNTPNIEQKNGFIFLKNREELITTRLNRYSIAENKFKKRLFVIRLLTYLPHIKMIAVCNSLATSNAKEESDIDLFIVTKKNKLWTTRLMAVALVSIFRLRPQTNKSKNTICLSFFTADDNLSLENLSCLPNDLHLKFWLSQFMPIYDEKNYFENFINANNWIKKTIPNWLPQQTNSSRYIKLNPFERALKSLLKFISAEKLLKKIQLAILSPNLKQLQNKDTRVIISDSMLKLHPIDRRQQYFNLWQAKLLDIKAKIS